MFRRLSRFILTAAITSMVASALSQQSGISIRSEVDRSTITIGDPIKYSLTIRRGEKDKVEKPPMAINLGQFEIRDYKELEGRKTEEGWIEDVTEYIITAYKTGDYEIPPVTVGFVTADGDSGEISSESIAITIESVKPSEAKNIRDIKPPVEIPGGIPAWMVAMVTAPALALAGFLYIRRRGRKGEAIEPAPEEPIDELAEFDKITALGLLEKGQYKQHYILVSEALRRYIERRYRIEAMERTTYELCRDMRDSEIKEESVGMVEGFLSECDLVKFAKYIPPMETMMSAVDRAKGIVEVTQEIVGTPEGTPSEEVAVGQVESPKDSEREGKTQ